MKKRYYILLPLLSLAGLLLAYLLVLAVLDPARLFMFLRDQTECGRIELYGRAVDGHSSPIAGATVTLTVEGPSIGFLFGGERGWSSTVMRSTDSSGCFELHGYRGKMLHVKDISKLGYVWEPPRVESDDENRSFHFTKAGGVYVADPANPAIYPLRLRGDNATTRTSRGGWTDGKRGEPVLPLPPSRWFN